MNFTLEWRLVFGIVLPLKSLALKMIDSEPKLTPGIMAAAHGGFNILGDNNDHHGYQLLY